MKPKLFMAALTAVIVVGSLVAGAGGNVVTAQAARTNVVIDWNVTMLATLATAKVPGAPATRLGAIVQASVFDALNGIDRRYIPIHVAPAAPEDASRQAAVASAAYTSLVSLFPDQKPAPDAARAGLFAR